MISGLTTPTTTHSRRKPVVPAIVSRDGERKLSAELESLRRELQVDFPRRLREARDFGEISQNDDYLQIKEEEAVVASRVQLLEAVLANATVFKPADAKPGATIGSLVEAEDLASGRVRTFRLTGAFEPRAPGDASVSSPVGRSVLGRTRGEEVTVELPGGRSLELRIVAVRSPRQA